MLCVLCVVRRAVLSAFAGLALKWRQRAREVSTGERGDCGGGGGGGGGGGRRFRFVDVERVARRQVELELQGALEALEGVRGEVMGQVRACMGARGGEGELRGALGVLEGVWGEVMGQVMEEGGRRSSGPCVIPRRPARPTSKSVLNVVCVRVCACPGGGAAGTHV